MRVTRNLPEQIIVEDRPLFWGLCIGAMIVALASAAFDTAANGEWLGFALIVVFIAAAVFMFAQIVVRTMVIFDRTNNRVELRRRSILRFQREWYDLDNVAEAIVQTSSSDDGDAHRLALVLSGGMDRGTRPVTQSYTTGRATHRAANAINAWLADKTGAALS